MVFNGFLMLFVGLCCFSDRVLFTILVVSLQGIFLGHFGSSYPPLTVFFTGHSSVQGVHNGLIAAGGPTSPSALLRGHFKFQGSPIPR